MEELNLLRQSHLSKEEKVREIARLIKHAREILRAETKAKRKEAARKRAARRRAMKRL